MTKQIMVDLETLGKGAGCKILSIGAVEFSPAGLGHEFYMEIKRSGQKGLKEDQSTIDWWMKQTPEARDRLFKGQSKKSTLEDVLSKFGDWILEVGGVHKYGGADICFWGNGADFDNAIVQYALASNNMGPQWPFTNGRCYRTLKALTPQVKFVRQGVYHNALDDAKSQAAHAIECLKYLEVWL